MRRGLSRRASPQRTRRRPYRSVALAPLTCEQIWRSFATIECCNGATVDARILLAAHCVIHRAFVRDREWSGYWNTLREFAVNEWAAGWGSGGSHTWLFLGTLARDWLAVAGGSKRGCPRLLCIDLHFIFFLQLKWTMLEVLLKLPVVCRY